MRGKAHTCRWLKIMIEDTHAGKFSPQKIYIKDASFETPHSPEIFTQDWEPEVNMDLSSHTKVIRDSIYEVVLKITVTVTLEEKTAYLAEIKQAGIFRIDGFSEEDMHHMVSTVCPNILFPFAREYVADLATRGGFPQLLLAPVNFEALYQQQQEAVTTAVSETKH